LVPRVKTSKAQRRAFSTVVPSVWNALPLRSGYCLPIINTPLFYKLLKSVLYRRGWADSVSE